MEDRFMDIVIEATISSDRRLTDYELPPDAPVGPVRLVIQPAQEWTRQQLPLTRETARARLLAAGALNTTYQAPADAALLPDDQLQRLVRPDHRSLDQLLDEDRGV